MYRLVAIILLLYSISEEINAIQNATIAKEIILPELYSTAVVNGSHLLTISSNKTHLQVNSTAEDICSIHHPLQKPIRAKLLDSKIIVWALHAKYESDSETKVDYAILIIDPLECNYTAISTPEETFAPYWTKNKNITATIGHDKCTFKAVSTTDILPRYWFSSGSHLPQVVAHDRDNFDVFYGSLTICSPCRYSIQGTKIHLERQIKPDTQQLPVFSQIEAFDSPELKRGYFYADSFRNQSAVVKLLDRDFNVVERKFLNHTVDVAVVSKGTLAGISICYMTSRPFPYHSYILQGNGKSANSIFCERYNVNLELEFSTELILPDKVEPKALTLNVDSLENLFVTVQSSNLNNDDTFTVYRMDFSRHFVDTFNLGEMKNSDSAIWNIRAFFIDAQYCLEITRQPANNSSSYDERVKCITI